MFCVRHVLFFLIHDDDEDKDDDNDDDDDDGDDDDDIDDDNKDKYWRPWQLHDNYIALHKSSVDKKVIP